MAGYNVDEARRIYEKRLQASGNTLNNTTQTGQILPKTPEQPNWLTNASQALFGGGLLGFKVDPKAAALPNESIPSYIGRRIREAGTEAIPPIANLSQPVVGVVKEFGSGLLNTAPPSTPLASTQPATTSTPNPTALPIMPGSSIMEQTSPIGRMGALEQRTYTTPQGTATGVLPTGFSRGGFVGASTDTEAAKNLQDRLAQDEAAKSIAQSTDRGVEALRDTRAAQLGITRNALDTAEGRANGPSVLPSVPSPFSQPGDSFGDEVLRRDQLVRDINNPRASKTDRKAAANIYNSYIDAAAKPAGISTPTVNPLDIQRFLLDQQRFGWQQGLDKNKLNINAAAVGAKVSEQNLNQSKYTAEQRANFLKDFNYPDEKAPQAELGALTWQLSQSTNGAIPPELMLDYVKKAADANGVDWKNAPPKSLVELGKKAMELVKADYQG